MVWVSKSGNSGLIIFMYTVYQYTKQFTSDFCDYGRKGGGLFNYANRLFEKVAVLRHRREQGSDDTVLLVYYEAR